MARHKSKIGTCYLCGKNIRLTKDHFIPKVYMKDFWQGDVTLFEEAFTIGCCSDCNKRKGDKILFPPLFHNSWMYSGFSLELLFNFSKFCNWAIKHYKTPYNYFEEWLDDYEKFILYGKTDSKFNVTKFYIEYNEVEEI